MKLNLLPKTVGTENRPRNAAILATLFIIACGAGAYLLNDTAEKKLTHAKEEVATALPEAQKVVKAAKSADDAMADPKVKQLVVNSALAKEMIEHCYVYPKLYADVIPYIPSYFRLTELSATPVDAKNANLNMTGVIQTYQEYADLMLALMRIPGAQTVGRAGFQQEDMVVPAVTSIDQSGKPRKLSEGPIPDDALDRLTYFEAQTQPSGYLAAGGFGSGDEGPKLAPFGKSLISVSVLMARPLQTPNPRATLASIGGGGAATAGGAAALNVGGPPTGSFGQGGPGTAPGGGAPPAGGTSPIGAAKKSAGGSKRPDDE